MFFTRFVVTALSFGAAALAAPIGMPGLPVDGLVPTGSGSSSGSSLPIDTGKLPIDASKLPLPISGGSVPSLGGGSGGLGLPYARRHDSTYSGALDGVQSAAQGLLSTLGGTTNITKITSGLGDLGSALGLVNSALAVPNLDLDGLLAGASLGDITQKSSEVFGLVNTVLSKVQALPAVSELKGELVNVVALIPKIESALGICPELQGVVNGALAKVLGLVGGLLGGLGLNL
ncbi:hypothetical protein RSOLAG22IIIB_00741 [Rhizoctonia solani]|uniref:Uncharacterized protein n=1 Tax=Rhizoctonia solani TaxID=456999 RepID=A0A0K6FW16_9AGAM|nr:hypothetical protein RSOLAG22IIIB_00741 [Rhizoctonia solani]